MENFDLVQELKLDLLQEYVKYVRTIAGITGTSEDDAREALHQAICKMLSGLRKRPPGNPVVTWRPYIIQAAINALRNEQEARRRATLFSELSRSEREKLFSIPDSSPTPALQAERKELATLAWRELDYLPACERQVIKKRCEGQSFLAIAGRLGMEPATARGYWTTGIAKLRVRLRPVA